MFVVIEEYIHKLSRAYDVIGVFNTTEEANLLAEEYLHTEGVYQNNCGYYYDCFVEEVETSFTIQQKDTVYILVKSGIYTGGPTRQTLTESSSTDRAWFERVIGIYKNMEEAKQTFITLDDNIGFYFCIKFVKYACEDEVILF
jgi:hypothetical protein